MAKNRYLAALLSFLIAGLGQLYVGTYWKAMVFFMLESITSYLYLKDSTSTLYLALGLIVGVASMIDAYETAKKTETAGERKEKPAEKTTEDITSIKAY